MYTLQLTADDIQTIHFVGHRYQWSAWLSEHASEGENRLAEHETWEFREACEADAQGGHSLFPMLNPRSDLADKLGALLESIV